MDMDLETENRLLKKKNKQLVEDLMELHSRLEMDYREDMPVRRLTLQEKLELNMGKMLEKVRIPSKDIKRIYYSIITSEDEPEDIDVSFNSQRYFTAFYIVNKEKEERDIEKGEGVKVCVEKVPDWMPELQQQYDLHEVVNRLTDINSPVSKVNHNNSNDPTD